VDILNFFSENASSLVGVVSAGFIGIIIAKGITLLYRFSLENKISKLVLKFIPEGIALGDILKGEKPNEERLYQAVVTVENRVLEAIPKPFRNYADKLIDSKKIAKEIERELNKEKYQGLAKPPVV
jgi:hypothetical protein